MISAERLSLKLFDNDTLKLKELRSIYEIYLRVKNKPATTC